MKKLIIILAAAAMAGCGIYKPYTRPEEIKTDGLYGQGVETVDTMTLGNISWQEMFTDPYLQQLIQQGLDNNTDLQSAYWRVKEAEATLKSARLAYLPSFNFAPNGGVSSLTNPWNATWTYTVPVTASWEVDIFGKLTNSKRRAKALLAQSQEYQQAVRTQVIASVANLYYTLLMLDAQYEISSETAEKWFETVNTMRAMKEAGMTNEAAVSQAEANYYSIETSLFDLEYQIREMENSLSSLLGEAPRSFERGTLDEQILPENLVVGIPAQMLSNRPDIKNAEYSLAQAFYNTAGARSAFYPALSLSGTLGWTNDGGVTTLDPAKWIFNAAASLVQPIFNAGRNQAQLRIPAVVPADPAQRWSRSEQCPRQMPVGTFQSRSAPETGRFARNRRREHPAPDAPWQHDLSRSADRTANPAVGSTVANQRPLLGDSGYRRSLPCPGRRP